MQVINYIMSITMDRGNDRGGGGLILKLIQSTKLDSLGLIADRHAVTMQSV